VAVCIEVSSAVEIGIALRATMLYKTHGETGRTVTCLTER